MIERIMNNSY